MKRLHQLRHDERGASLLYITVGFLSFFAASALAIDVGMLMTARGQAQTSADAGALAGAIALALDDFDDRSADGPAVLASVNTALENSVINDGVSVQPDDVTFPVGPGGQADRVRVRVFRTATRNNPLTTFIMAVFGSSTADLTATATAEAAPANAMTCVRPFTIPDKWTENEDPEWTSDSVFNRYDNKGDLVLNADEYHPQGDPDYVGWNQTRDKGTPLTLRAGSGNNIQPTFYYSWAMPGGTGGSWYEENIWSCNQTVMQLEQAMTQEPGNMVGPTIQGIEALVAQDPTAYWDDDCNCVKSPLGRSPRIFPIPLYNPDKYDHGKINGRTATLEVANWIGFFVEDYSGNEVYGRITPVLGMIDGDAGPAPADAAIRAIRLVE